MDVQYEYNERLNHFYLVIKKDSYYYPTAIWDYEIAEVLYISQDEYRQIVKEKFNGYEVDGSYEIRFRTEDSVKMAHEWIISKIVMNKLVGLR